MKNIIVTSGGTSEKIDEARFISNTSTGKLGSLIADEFSKYKCINKIFYICGKNSLKPNNKSINVIEINNINQLQNTIDKIISENKIHGFIHSMAVSDYKVSSLISLDDLITNVFNNIEEIKKEEDLRKLLIESFKEKNLINDSKKLTSNLYCPIMLLDNNLKIISTLRKKLPESIIVGFKLLSNVSESNLLNVAYELLIKNDCNYVLANDSSTITNDYHKGYLLNKNKEFKILNTKQEIAMEIAKEVLKGEILN